VLLWILQVGAEELDTDVYKSASEMRARLSDASRARSALEGAQKALGKGQREEDADVLDKVRGYSWVNHGGLGSAVTCCLILLALLSTSSWVWPSGGMHCCSCWGGPGAAMAALVSECVDRLHASVDHGACFLIHTQAIQEASQWSELIGPELSKAREALESWRSQSATEAKLTRALREGTTSTTLARLVQEASAAGVKVTDAKRVLKLLQVCAR
jgi:hypothetical protein